MCSTAQSSMTIQLRVHKHVEFGEAIHAVGAITELGGWVPELGAALSWCEGDFWAASVRLPVTEEPIKFKVRAFRTRRHPCGSTAEPPPEPPPRSFLSCFSSSHLQRVAGKWHTLRRAVWPASLQGIKKGTLLLTAYPFRVPLFF